VLDLPSLQIAAVGGCRGPLSACRFPGSDDKDDEYD
jgi:hypothetical protein